MTIAEHLNFSIVSAPLAQVDRRTLSQAWYSALYGACAPAAQAQPEPQRGTTPNASRVPVRRELSTAGPPAHEPRADAKHDAGTSSKTLAAPPERRSARSPLARRIERRFSHPAAKPSAATFALEGAAGRVQVLLKGAGPNVRLVAICAPAARAQVCAALAQARYNLASRGLALAAETRVRA